MKDYPILKFLDLFKRVFEKTGIDYPSMRKLLQLKLTLDSRRSSTLTDGSLSKKEGNNFYKSLIMYFIFGLLLMAFIIMGDSYLFQMSLVFGMFMFFMMTALVSDFSSVLLDLRDREILLSKPIDFKTLNMAKILHIIIYTSMISLAIILPSLLLGLIKNGFLFFIIYIIEIILINLFLIVITGLTYLLILKFYDGEKLRDIINYVQIVLTISMAISYQFLGRIFEITNYNLNFSINKWWSVLLPSTWFAAPFELILKGNSSSFILVLSALSLIMPILSMVVYIKNMSAFENNLQKLLNAGGRVKTKKRTSDKIGDMVCRSDTEKIFYRFISNMIRNERQFKLRVYPSLGFSIVFPFLMLLNSYRGIGLKGIVGSKAYFSIYYVAFFLPTIMQFVGCSDNYKGAWIYKVMPIKNYEDIFKASIKAIFINLLTPIILLVSLIFLLIFKLKIIFQIPIIYLNLLIGAIFIFKLFKKDLPFARPFSTTDRRNGFHLMISAVVSIAALAGLHFLALNFKYVIYIYFVMQIIFIKYAFKHLFDVKVELN